MKATFGQTIRAHRQGFRKMPGRECWLRIGVDKSLPEFRSDPTRRDAFIVDVVPLGLMPKATTSDHYVWWEGDQESIAKIVNAIRELLPPALTEQFTFLMDDDGDLVG